MRETYVRKAIIKRVIDADSFHVDVDLGFGIRKQQHIRLAKVNCPESRGVESMAGMYVTEVVNRWIDQHNTNRQCMLHSHQFTFGKYGRCIAEIWINDYSLNDFLLVKRYAWRTDERGRIAEPRTVESLNLPDAVKQAVRERDV